MSDHPNFLEDIQKGKPESFQEEVFSVHKRNYLPIYVGIGAALVIIIVILVTLNRGVEVPDMTGWKEGEVYNWGKENNITIVKQDVYKLEVESGLLFEQSVAAGKTVRKSSSINVKISLGADPNELIPLIDLKTSDEATLRDWIDTNKLTGISIRYESNNVIEKGKIIEYEVVDGSEDTFKRKNRITVYVSSGPEVISDTIAVPDFYKQTKSTVAQWGEKNGIQIEYTEAFDEYIENGQVRTQSIPAESKMLRTDVLKIELSLGKPILVPNFVGMNQTEASSLATLKGITVFFVKKLSTEKANLVIEQSIPEKEYYKKSDYITLYVSEGNIIVPSFVGLSKEDSEDIATNIGLKLTTKEVDTTSSPKGTVIKQSVSSGTVVTTGENDTIKLEIASNTGVIPPDFSNYTKAELTRWAANNGVALDSQVIIIENYSDTVAYGKLYNQSIKGRLLGNKEDLLIYYSLGQIPIADFTGKSKVEVNEWINGINGKGGQLTVEFYEIESKTGKAGAVVGQSEISDYINLNTKVIVYLAKSQDIIVPDFSAKTVSEVKQWGIQNNVKITIEERYTKNYTSGKLYYQSVIGRLLVPADGVTLYQAMDQVTVPNFVNEEKKDVVEWVDLVNARGATITANYVSSSGSVIGNISGQSSPNAKVALNATLTFYVVSTIATTNPTPSTETVYVPNMTGSYSGTFKNWCEINGVTDDLIEQYNDTYLADIVYGQNVSNDYMETSDSLKAFKSLGKPVLSNPFGTCQALITWLDGANLKGANITISNYSDVLSKPGSTVTGITIGGQAKNAGDAINTGSTITVTYNP